MITGFFQKIITQMREEMEQDIGVIDSLGNVVASTCREDNGKVYSGVLDILAKSKDRFFADTDSNKIFMPISSKNETPEFAVFVTGTDAVSKSICKAIAVSISSVKDQYDEKYDKTFFIKNIIAENILSGDIYIRSKELEIENEIPRVILVIRQRDKNTKSVIEMLERIFPNKKSDFVIGMDKTDIVIVKEIHHDTDIKQLIRLAKSIESNIVEDLVIQPVIGIGSIAMSLKELSRSYREALSAIEVGMIFDTDNTVVSYENLGVGRLIYQLPATLCELFLTEVFRNSSFDMIDRETLYSVDKFFENNLNVSETARNLFIHRNTLVYRLDKVRKITGLDLREFDHAIVFKVALMVKKYLSSCEKR